MAIATDFSELITAAASGDDEASWKLVVIYEPLIQSISNAFSKQHHWALAEKEDVLTNCRRAAHNLVQTFDPDKGVSIGWYLKSYLSKTLASLMKNSNQFHANETSYDTQTEFASIDESFEERTNNKLVIREAIKKLTKRQQQALYLYYFEDYSEYEACVIMNISQPAFNMLLTRARSGLKEILRNSF